MRNSAVPAKIRQRFVTNKTQRIFDGSCYMYKARRSDRRPVQRFRAVCSRSRWWRSKVTRSLWNSTWERASRSTPPGNGNKCRPIARALAVLMGPTDPSIGRHTAISCMRHDWASGLARWQCALQCLQHILAGGRKMVLAMLIRVGFEAAFDFAEPTAVVLMAYVHPSRAPTIRQLERLTVTPQSASTEYYDIYGNLCDRIVVPAGRVTFRTSAVVEDDGQPDVQVWTAFQHQVQDLPNDVLLFLLPSRYCEVDSELRDIAWSTVRQTAGRLAAGAGGVQLRPQAHSLRLHAGPRQSNGARSVSRAGRRLPRLHASGDHVLPQPECAGTVLHRLSRRHRRAAAAVSDGFQRLVRSVSWAAGGTRSTPATTRRGSAAS